MSQPEAEVQLQRVLAMVPWLATHPGVHKDEVAQRFHVSRAQLERDLALIMMVGVPPYSPGDYIDVEYEGDTVDLLWPRTSTGPCGSAPARVSRCWPRATRCSPSAARTPTVRSRTRSRSSRARSARSRCEFGTPENLGVVRAAAEAGETHRDRLLERRPGPGDHPEDRSRTRVLRARGVVHRRVLPSAGRAPDVPHRSDTRRSSDRRCASSRPQTGRRAPCTRPGPHDPQRHARAAGRRQLGRRAVPGRGRGGSPAGGQRVVLRVSELVWLERVLLRAGPEARVLEPADQRGVGPAAAARVLARYQPS